MARRDERKRQREHRAGRGDLPTRTCPDGSIASCAGLGATPLVDVSRTGFRRLPMEIMEESPEILVATDPDVTDRLARQFEHLPAIQPPIPQIVWQTGVPCHGPASRPIAE